jgi:hypothetical protein
LKSIGENILLEVENIYVDNLDDLFNALKQQLDAIPTWTKQKHAIANQMEQVLVNQQYHHDFGHKIRLYLTGGIGTSLIYKVPERKIGKFAAYRGKIIRLVNFGSHKMEVGYYIKELTTDEVNQLHLLHKFPREIRIKKLNLPEFWAQAVNDDIFKHLWIDRSYFRKVTNFGYAYSSINCFKLCLLEYYLPKNQVTEALFTVNNQRFSKGLYVTYVEIILKINNFDTFTDIHDVDFEMTKISSKYFRFSKWNESEISDHMIKNYLALEGFEKESRINQPELELAITEFLKGSHSPEIEAMKRKLRPHLLWDKQLQKQIQSLFKKLSIQTLDA